MIEAIVVDGRPFVPVRITEERLEGLLRTCGPQIFPGYDYFEFKPAIRCGASTRHPDGVLLAPGRSEWWVVEVETHLHDPYEHIEPQLRDLANGFYGPDAFAFLERHDGFDARRYPIDPYEPLLLLVVDVLTPEIRALASGLEVPAVECATYRAETTNQYAIAVSGPRPRADLDPLARGIELRVEEREGMATLSPVDGKRMPVLKGFDLTVGGALLECYETSDRAAIVLPLTVAELFAATAECDRFKLITQTATLVPILPTADAPGRHG